MGSESGKPVARGSLPEETSRYSILVPAATRVRAATYLAELQAGVSAGARLDGLLRDVELAQLEVLDLLGLLVDTKPPQLFAESAVAGDGSDWNLTELGLLGDISIAVPVTVYDNGAHTRSSVHAQPFAGTLLFTPGALLANGRGCSPADLAEVTDYNGELDGEGYYRLYRRRLLPVLRWICQQVAEEGSPGSRSAFVTVPGLGCGAFAGRFQESIHEAFRQVLRRLLIELGTELPKLAAVYYDPFRKCTNTREEIHGISFFVRPLEQGNHGKSQLCQPHTYAPGFAHCQLFSLVAWDHVSWPGNDFFAGARKTDDGVKAAATNSMAMITGIEGHYDPVLQQYQPPSGYHTWGQLVRSRGLRLWDPRAVWLGQFDL